MIHQGPLPIEMEEHNISWFVFKGLNSSDYEHLVTSLSLVHDGYHLRLNKKEYYVNKIMSDDKS